MILNGRSSNFGFADDKYKFTSKELDTETGYFYFGARAYDGRIGRWLQVDPLAAKYPNVSPYNYALCNPLRFIDPKGKDVYGTYLAYILSAKRFGRGFSIAYTYDDQGNAGFLVSSIFGVGVGKFSGFGVGSFHYSQNSIFDLTSGILGGFSLTGTLGLGASG
jgi:RHS repeat-associated protein